MKKLRKGILAGLMLGCFLLALFTACEDDPEKPKKKPTSPTYSITLDSGFIPGKGTVNFVPRGSFPATAVPAGTIVDMYCNPATGTDNTVGDIIFSGDPVELTQMDGAYYFTMPARNLTVNVIFQLEPGPDEYTITKGPVYQERGNFRISPMDPQEAGAAITLDVTCRAGFKVHSINVLGDELVNVSMVTENVKYTFAMPAFDVTVFVIFTVTSGTDTTHTVAKGAVNAEEGSFTLLDAEGVEITPTYGLLEGMPVFIKTEPAETFRVTDVTVSGSPTVNVNMIERNVSYLFLMPGRNVTVDVEFQGPPSYDLAAESFKSHTTDAPRAFASRGANNTPLSNAFNGEWGNNFQLGNGTADTWLAIDLGEVIPIRTVRVVWGLSSGAAGDFNGIVGYKIQISTSNTFAAATWSDVDIVTNPGNNGTNIRNDQERVNHREFSQSYPARFVRILQNDGYDSGAAASNDRPWTNWPAWTMFEVYAIANVPPIAAPIANKSIGFAGTGGSDTVIETGGLRVIRPVWGGTAAALNTDYAPTNSATGQKYTAKLVNIDPPAAAGAYAPKTAYKFTFELETKNANDWFNETGVNIFLKNDAAPYSHASPATMLEGEFNQKKFSVSYTFPATESDIISNVEYSSSVKQAIHGERLTDESNYSPANALYTSTLAIKEGNAAAGPFDTDFTIGNVFQENKFYQYTFTITASSTKAYSFATDVEVADIDLIQPAAVTANTGRTTLTVVYVFNANDDRFVSHGAIDITVPAPGNTPPAYDNTEYSSDTSIFTAKLTAVTGTLASGRFAVGNDYTYEFTLTASTGYKFGNIEGVEITINGKDAVYEFTNATTAKAKYTFAKLAYPVEPDAINLALNRHAATRNSNTNNSSSAVLNMVDGNVGTIWQGSDTDGHAYPSTPCAENWIVVDLGADKDIGTIVLYHSIGGTGGAESVNTFQADSAVFVAPSSAARTEPDTAMGLIPAADDTAYVKAMDFDGRLPAYTAGMDNWIRLTVPLGTNGRFVLIKGPAHWPRVQEFEVYSAGPSFAARITTKTATITELPVAGHLPPAVGHQIGEGTNFKVHFVKVVNEGDLSNGTKLNAGEFDYSTAYEYEVRLVADSGYRFSTSLPTINGAAITALNVISITSKEMVVRYTCRATEADPEASKRNVTFAGTITANGLTVEGEPFQGVPGTLVEATIFVKGTSTKATVYTAKITPNTTIADLAFKATPTSSPVATRNIGGGGRSTASATMTTGTDGIVTGTGVSGETIGGNSGEGSNGATGQQPEANWTFVFGFTMPDADIVFTIDNTFRTDIMPAIIASTAGAAVTESLAEHSAVKYSLSANGTNTGVKMFNGQYSYQTQSGATGGQATLNRWETSGGQANGQWVAVNLGKEYNITDAVFRMRGDSAMTGLFHVFVSNTATHFTDLKGGTGATANAEGNTAFTTLAGVTTAGWTLMWTISNGVIGTTGSGSSYVPVFYNTAGANALNYIKALGTRWQNGNGPYPRSGGEPTGAETAFSITGNGGTGQYVLLWIERRLSTDTAQGCSINNFEIYGTPVSP